MKPAKVIRDAVDNAWGVRRTMPKERFHIIVYEYEIPEGACDSELIDEEDYHGDLSTALDALDKECWDHIDERFTGEGPTVYLRFDGEKITMHPQVICYPADTSTNYRTGQVTERHVVIEAKTDFQLETLLNYWRSDAYRR